MATLNTRIYPKLILTSDITLRMGGILMQDTNEWAEWSRNIVMEELRRLNSALANIEKSIAGVHKDMSSINVEIAMLKVKSGIWGLLGGAIPVVAALLYYLLTK